MRSLCARTEREMTDVTHAALGFKWTTAKLALTGANMRRAETATAKTHVLAPLQSQADPKQGNDLK